MENLKGNEANARSFAMRLLVHYVGDLHQPLHSGSRLNSNYPSGDRGGNYFAVQEIDQVDNLHLVWDSILYSQKGRPTLPLSNEDWIELGFLAKELQ